MKINQAQEQHTCIVIGHTTGQYSVNDFVNQRQAARKGFAQEAANCLRYYIIQGFCDGRETGVCKSFITECYDSLLSYMEGRSEAACGANIRILVRPYNVVLKLL
jgi:hypothetical protein